MAQVNRPIIRRACLRVIGSTTALSHNPTSAVQPREWGWTPPRVLEKESHFPNHMISCVGSRTLFTLIMAPARVKAGIYSHP